MQIKEQERIFKSDESTLSVAVTRLVSQSPYEWTTVNLANYGNGFSHYEPLNTSQKRIVLNRIAASIRDLESSNRL